MQVLNENIYLKTSIGINDKNDSMINSERGVSNRYLFYSCIKLIRLLYYYYYFFFLF